MSDDVVKIGLISSAHMHALGYAGTLAEREDARLAYVWDEDMKRARMLADRFGCEVFESLEILLAQKPQAVIVCSENSNHYRHVLAALAAGCDVLCEKPLATSVEHCDEMIAAANAMGRILATSLPCRVSPVWKRAKELALSGKIGEIMAAKCTNRGKNPGGWFNQPELSGGGCIMDHTVHVADLLYDLSDEAPEWVHAHSFTPDGAQVETAALLTMQYPSGMFATLDASWSRPAGFRTWGDVRLQLIGTDGTLGVDLFAQNYTVTDGATGQVSERFWGSSLDEALMDDFVGAVRERRAPIATGEDGRQAVRVAVAAYHSTAKGCPVKLMG
jgi:predicted dehydrogenase